MYRMVIVDDLPVIVDDLMLLFGRQRQLDLELHAAYSAPDALELMNNMDIHIVLSDIRMPEMEGIELLHEIRKRWQACKVIFLTSYDDFHYVKEAISGGASGYILKDEHDEKIIAAVEKVVAQLDEEYETKRKLYEADIQKLHLQPEVIQNYFLPYLQRRRVWSTRETKERFEAWNIPLRYDAPVWMLLGRIDRWGAWKAEDRELMRRMVQNIAGEYWQDKAATVSFACEPSKIVWLLQAETREGGEDGTGPQAADEPLFAFILGELGHIQEKCRTLLKLPISFAAASSASSWDTLPDTFDKLSFLLLSDRGAEPEAIIADRERQHAARGEAAPAPTPAPNATATANKVHKRNTKRIALLRHDLETGQQDAFARLLREVMDSISRPNVAGFYKLEVYHALASIFLSYFNVHPVRTGMLNDGMLNRLTQVDPEVTAQQMTDYFMHLAQTIFACNEMKAVRNDREVISWIQDYVSRNLQEDLSLNRLADLVQLNPSYLSRLYRQGSDTGLLDFIQQCRINKAKELLKHSACKVYEIAEMVGYESRLSFIRMFKNQVGMTPQEYREL